jgi:hypothetical protein
LVKFTQYTNETLPKKFAKILPINREFWYN